MYNYCDYYVVKQQEFIIKAQIHTVIFRHNKIAQFVVKESEVFYSYYYIDINNIQSKIVKG